MAQSKALGKEIARQLRSQGWSLNDIVKKLNVSKSSVSTWVRDVVLTEEQKVILREREITGGEKGRKLIQNKWQEYRKLNPKPIKGPRWPDRTVETFFDNWNPDMAYVLGYFAADGTMYKNERGSHYVAFVSTDKELIEIVKRLMGVSNQIEEYQSLKKNHKRRYTIQIGSKRMYLQLLQLGFTSNKSLTMKFPPVPNELLGHFLRGYLDGDGCVHHGIYKRKNRPSPVIILTIKFTSGSKDFLISLRHRLFSAGVGNGCLTSNGSAWYLSYGAKKATRQLYKFMYPVSTAPCLRRKRDIFQKGILSKKGPVA